ncbi:MAG: nucleotide-binding protein [Sulfurovaceae bacterium]|nr:nucleotide-binding protein [Sulfurovaceae bacterium]
MKSTFGSSLLEFSKTVDILEAENFDKIQKHVETYLLRVLQIRYVRLMLVHEMLGGQLMLQKYVLNRKADKPLLLRDAKGEYNGQMAYAFEENQKLWITAKEADITLDECQDEYLDHWGEKINLPSYKQFDERDKVKTSIIIPIQRDNNIDESNYIFGVVNFESQEHLPMTKNAQKELKNISYALGKLFQLHEGRKFQRSNTSSVIDSYGQSINRLDEKDREYFFKPRPTIFFAFSGKADKEVTDTIKEVIQNSFSEKLTFITWDDTTNVGSITTQLLENMSKSDYLICYLSEKDKEELQYRDNPNVLIELGFFMGKNRESRDCSNIIIIREEESQTALPFDIQDIFTLGVSRYKSEENSLNADLFTTALKGKINKSIDSCRL